jgi:hypothetical protein
MTADLVTDTLTMAWFRRHRPARSTIRTVAARADSIGRYNAAHISDFQKFVECFS